MKIWTPIQDNYFLVDFLCGIRNNTESSHIDPYFAADTLYKIQLLTNEKPAPEMEPSDWSKVGSYIGCPQQNMLYMRTFNIIPDPTQKIYQEIIVLDGGPDFHPP